MNVKISLSKSALILILVAGFAVGGQAQNSATYECVRATPAPIIKKSVHPKTSFVLRKNKEFPFNPLGYETVKFNNGDKLIVEHSGCENYTLTFRFETRRFKGKIGDARFWFRKAVALMRQTKKGYGSSPLLDGGTKALNARLKSNKSIKYAETIDFGGTDIRDVVSVNRVAKRKGGVYLIEISFGTGPL